MMVTSVILVISFGLSTAVSLKSLDKLIKENNLENSVIYANEVANSVVDVFSEAVAVSETMNNTLIRHILDGDTSFTQTQKDEIIRKYLADIVSTFGYSTAFLADDKTMGYYAESVPRSHKTSWFSSWQGYGYQGMDKYGQIHVKKSCDSCGDETGYASCHLRDGRQL